MRTVCAGTVHAGTACVSELIVCVRGKVCACGDHLSAGSVCVQEPYVFKDHMCVGTMCVQGWCICGDCVCMETMLACMGVFADCVSSDCVCGDYMRVGTVSVM